MFSLKDIYCHCSLALSQQRKEIGFVWFRFMDISRSCPILTYQLKSIYSLVGDEFFHLTIPFSQMKYWNSLTTLSLFPYQYSDEIHSLIPLVQFFTAKTHHATSTGTNHPHFLCNKETPSDSFFPRIITILISKSRINHFPTYPHNLYFLSPLQIDISDLLYKLPRCEC